MQFSHSFNRQSFQESFTFVYPIKWSFPGGSLAKNLLATAGDAGLLPESGRCGEGHSNPLQYSCLGNPMDRGAWRATVHGFAKSWT